MFFISTLTFGKEVVTGLTSPDPFPALMEGLPRDPSYLLCGHCPVEFQPRPGVQQPSALPTVLLRGSFVTPEPGELPKFSSPEHLS